MDSFIQTIIFLAVVIGIVALIFKWNEVAIINAGERDSKSGVKVDAFGQFADYTAWRIAREFDTDGYMYQTLRPFQISDLMLVIGTRDKVRINVQSDTSLMYESLPKTVWERDYDLREMVQASGVDPAAVTIPLTNHECKILHQRIQDAMLWMPHITLKQYRELHDEYRFSEFYISFYENG